ncbi:tripartite tricarboxylate transporter TctB family protein [Limimaricola pyoseonensis]|uniref:Putative tricarboxylic transport membrane protein n=1 Tax=Limimaricola pyoseonensis TaxID=521013 RepID=A0A1G7HK51_9RHOB|nr:tripartite tricarboxylate transporter TctB family protein [Limimaricola pyoseonensis]SDF00654.1 putative tricarboxylic transport membrane protein [Limimaricola pyoseonensis]
MADRIFAGVLLAVTMAYAAIAFTAISAPFQYDPLGPESWPRILAVVALACIAGILWKPDTEALGIARQVWFRLAATVLALIAYAELYEPLGFVVATFLYGTVMALMLGAPRLRAAGFGLAAGIIGYLVCASLLGLNLPLGELVEAAFTETETATEEEG